MNARHAVIISRFFYPDHAASSQQLTDLARDLVAHGWAVSVLTSRKLSDSPTSRLKRRESVEGIEIRRVWTSRFGRRWLPGRAIDYLSFYFSIYFTLRAMLSFGSVVIADSDPPLLSVVVARACRARRVALLCHVADLYPDIVGALGMLRSGGLVLRFLIRWRNKSFNRAQAVVVLGARMKDCIVRSGIDPDLIHVIPNWADGDAIRPLDRAENPIRNEWGLENRFVVGYCGNMGRAHEFDTMLQAANALRDRDDVHFLIVGGGARRAGFEKRVDELGLKNISFKPYQPRESLNTLLTLPDVHIISLRPGLEGMVVPCKYYGIAAAGRAAIYIGDPHGDIARTIAQADGGATVPVGDADTLAALLVEFADDPDRCRRLGKNSRHDFEARFNKPIPLATWRKLLNRLVDDCAPQH